MKTIVVNLVSKQLKAVLGIFFSKKKKKSLGHEYYMNFFLFQARFATALCVLGF